LSNDYPATFQAMGQGPILLPFFRLKILSIQTAQKAGAMAFTLAQNIFPARNCGISGGKTLNPILRKSASLGTRFPFQPRDGFAR